MKRALLPAGIFAACTLVGWLAGQLRQPTAAAKEASAANAMPAKSRRAPVKSRVPSEVSLRLAEIRATTDPQERLRAAMQLAYTIPTGEIERWYSSNWFGEGRQDMESHLFYRVLRVRWLEADAEGLMDYCLRKNADNTHEIANEWAAKDPAAALAYLEQLKDPSRRSQIASGIGPALAEADPRLVLSRIPEFHRNFSQNESSIVAQMIGQLAKTSPDLLRGESKSWPDGLKDQVMVALTGASLKRGFASGIAELAATEKGKSVFMKAVQRNSELMQEVAKQPELLPKGWLGAAINGSGSYYLVQKDPRRWLDMDLAALGLTESEASQVRSSAIGQLGSRNPGELLSLLTSGQLDSKYRMSAIGNLVQTLPKDQVEGFLATLTDEKELMTAQQNRQGREDQATKEPPTPAGLFESLAKENANFDWRQSEDIGKWTKEQIKGFPAEFDALPAAQKPLIAAKLAQNDYRALPREIETHVIEYLIENPPPKPEEGSGRFQQQSNPAAQAATQLAARWADEDPNAASKWVSSLPAGEERLWAAKNLASRWADYEPKAAASWMATLPAAERKEVQDYVKTGGAKGP